MAYPQTHDESSSQITFPVYPKIKKGRNRQCRADNGYPVKAAEKILPRLFACKASYPSIFVQKHAYDRYNQPKIPNRPTVNIKARKYKRRASNTNLSHSFKHKQQFMLILIVVFVRLMFCPYQVGNCQHPQKNKTNIRKTQIPHMGSSANFLFHPYRLRGFVCVHRILKNKYMRFYRSCL